MGRHSDEQPSAQYSMPLLLGMAFLAYCLISVTIGSPILGSDEYAYFISGKYSGSLQELYRLDPGLQRLSNLLFFQWIHFFTQRFGADFVPVFRIIHGAEYTLAAGLLYLTFRDILGTKSVSWGTLAMLLLPGTLYIHTAMPETELALFAAMLGYLLLVVFPRRQYLAMTLAGILLGASILVKPHAVALLAAVTATVMAAFLTGCVKGGALAAFRTTALLLGSCLLTCLLLWRLCSGVWTLNPSVMLGLGFYGQYLQTQTPTAGFFQRIAGMLQYFLAHLAVISLIFPPVIGGGLVIAMKRLKARHAPDEQTDGFALSVLFVVAMFVFHAAMTAYFTAGAAALDAGEAMRLHGRYLGPALIFFPFMYFYALEKLRGKELKIVLLVALCALLVSYFYLFRGYKIFPWDYPLLFAFFTAPNHYGWSYGGEFSRLGSLLVWYVAAGCIISICFEQLRQRVLFIQLFVIVLVGGIQTYAWAYGHTRGNSQVATSARALGTIINTQQPGKGVVVADERYGRASYLLFNLANAPRVLIRKPGSAVTPDDVAGADWVLFGNQFAPEFAYAKSIAFNGLTLFPLNLQLRLEQQEKKVLMPGRQIKVSLGASGGAAQLNGFNAREEWGAWTARPLADIELPFKVQGRVQLDLFGWSLAENLGKPLKLSIGDATVRVVLSGSAAHHLLTLQVRQPADRIVLQAPTVRPANSSREMGVAIGSIAVSRTTR